MAYLTKRQRGEQTYYYIVENIPIAKGRRKQIRKYIGKLQPSETKLQILLSQFEEEIVAERKKILGHHYLTSDEISEIERINGDFWKRYNSQNPAVQEQFDQNFVMVFVYNTNSIEGSTLTPKEVELLLAENISPNKPLDDVLEAKSAQRTIQFVKEYNGKFDEDFLFSIHEMYFKDTKPYIAGKYKTKENYLRASKFNLTPPGMVPTDMKLFFKEFENLRKQLHPLELAAWAHWKIVRIHPFQDGNGRTARIVMNYILHRNGYGMIDIETKERLTYINTLERCNYANNGRALAIRLVRRFKKQYEKALVD